MNMLNEYTLILRTVKSIINELRQSTHNYPINSIDVINDNDDSYRAIIEFDSCIGEVTVDQPFFAPYRYVKIEILSVDSDPYESVFSWYDSDYDNIDSIRRHISLALQAASDHTAISNSPKINTM